MAMVHADLCQKAWIAGTMSACALALATNQSAYLITSASSPIPQENPSPPGGVGAVDGREEAPQRPLGGASSGTRAPCSSRKALEPADFAALSAAKGLSILPGVQVRRHRISPRVTGVYILVTVCSNHIRANTSSAPRSSCTGKVRRFPSNNFSSYAVTCWVRRRSSAGGRGCVPPSLLRPACSRLLSVPPWPPPPVVVELSAPEKRYPTGGELPQTSES